MSEANQTSDRRNSLGHMAYGAGLATFSSGASFGQAQEPAQPVPKSARLPREVWIATIAQTDLRSRSYEQMAQRMLARMAEVVPYEPDIICLPEEFPCCNLDGGRPRVSDVAEKQPGPISKPFGEFARKHHCYVICPINTRDDAGHCFNAAILFDRQGEIAGEYRKVHPALEEMDAGITPGPLDPPVFKTDFGTIGIQICYDIEWPFDWQKLRAKGAEIIFYPTGFAAGTVLNSLAWLNKVCTVSSSSKDTCKICDLTGEELARTSRWNLTACAPVNLERAFIPVWPGVSRLRDLQAKYGRKVRLRIHAEEEWAIVESRSPEVFVADVLKEFGLQTREESIALADAAQRNRRPA